MSCDYRHATNIRTVRLKTSRQFLLPLFSLWSNIALIFGVQLYLYGDLDNPKVSLLIPFSKDILWMVIALVLAAFLLEKRTPAKFLALPLYFVFLNTSILLIVFASGNYELLQSFIAPVKNIILHFSLPFVIFIFALERGLKPELVRIISNALLVSLVASSALYLFSPIQSVTGRLFGTYGNPNSAAFIASTLLFLVSCERNHISSLTRFLAPAVSIAVLVMASSISAIVAVAIYLAVTSNWFASHRFARKKFMRSSFARYSIFPLLLLILILSTSSFLSEKVTEVLGQRLVSLETSGSRSDTVSVRLNDLSKTLSMDCGLSNHSAYYFGCAPSRGFTRMDGAIMSTAYNYGYPSCIVFTILIFYGAFRRVYYRKTFPQALRHHNFKLIIGFFTIIMTNLLIQHSIDLFPANYVYAFLIALSYHQSRYIRPSSIIDSDLSDAHKMVWHSFNQPTNQPTNQSIIK